MSTTIPPELIEMLRQRRVIPFLGAGFSSGHGLPDWDALLRQVSQDVSDIPDFETIKRCCNADYLQIAEYLFIKSDRSIGPLRHKLSTLLQSKVNFLDSTPHVELVNLNPQQIYTTNYDEVIEGTYRALEYPFAAVALPKHIAAANKDKTQIVKYHGDLRYDQTLVLTESSYYNRLEFESPMDLKFRSDLLGQSVLFVGYSFRDINIRIIWFKLMEMMRDVPEADRPSSYIVRFERNEVLEDLYRAVGIQTICLDPNKKAKTPDERNRLLGRFMLDLSVKMNTKGVMPTANSPMFMSVGLLETIREGIKARNDDWVPSYIEHASRRVVPSYLLDSVDELLTVAASSSRRSLILANVGKWAVRHITRTNAGSPGASFAIMKSLLREGSRDELLEKECKTLDWAHVWSPTLPASSAEHLVKMIVSEVESHRDFPDKDIAYAADIATRILNGIVTIENFDDFAPQLKDALHQMTELYPAVASIKPIPDGFTDLSDVLAQIPEDDIPF